MASTNAFFFKCVQVYHFRIQLLQVKHAKQNVKHTKHALLLSTVVILTHQQQLQGLFNLLCDNEGLSELCCQWSPAFDLSIPLTTLEGRPEDL